MSKNEDTPAKIPEDAQSSNNSYSLQKIIEISSKIALSAVGLAYVVGLLILNLHLRRYGIFHLNFLQPEYVIVGALWIFSVGYMLYVSLFSIQVFRSIYAEWKGKEPKEKGDTRRKALEALKQAFLLISIPIFLLINSLSDDDSKITKARFWFIIGFLLVSGWVALAFTTTLKQYLLNALAGRNLSPQTSRVHDIFEGRAGILSALYWGVVLLGVLSLYALHVFPYLSPAIGGGKKQKAEFVIKKDRIDTINRIGLQVTPDDGKLDVVEIIFEGSDYFIIAPPNEFNPTLVKAIRINKEDVGAVLYIREKEVYK